MCCSLRSLKTSLVNYNRPGWVSRYGPVVAPYIAPIAQRAGSYLWKMAKRKMSGYVPSFPSFKRSVLAGTGRRNRIPRRGIQTELKVADTASTVFACDTTGSVTALNLTAVGDDNTNRDGRQIVVKSCQIKGIFRPQDNVTGSNLARVLLVWDSQPSSGAIATVTDIMNAATSVAPTNLNNRERFTILRDFQAPLGPTQDTATQAFAGALTVQDLDWYVKINRVSTYSGTTAVIASVATGALLLVTLGSQGAGAGSDLVAYARVRFSDS